MPPLPNVVDDDDNNAGTIPNGVDVVENGDDNDVF
jgi:hypothetical protein